MPLVKDAKRFIVLAKGNGIQRERYCTTMTQKYIAIAISFLGVCLGDEYDMNVNWNFIRLQYYVHIG